MATSQGSRFRRFDARSALAVILSVNLACSGASGGNSQPVASPQQSGPAAENRTASTSVTPGHLEDITRSVVQSSDAVVNALVGNKPGEKLSPAESLERLKKMYGLLETAARLNPRETFDVEAVAAQAGKDPVKLSDWVRDNVALVPYRGSLRGAAGVLMDRVGNSLDRALLLAALVKTGGGAVRLAHAQLQQRETARLWEIASNSRPSSPAAPSVESLIAYARQNGMDAPAVESAVQNRNAELARTIEQIRARVDHQASTLATAIDDKGPHSPTQDAARQAKLSDHWWVQWQRGSEWIDLDPAANQGQTIASPSETLEIDRLPADLYHRVQIRVVAEQWDGTAYRESRPLSYTVRPFSILGQPLRLTHASMHWPTDGGGAQKAIAAETEWLPVLTIGAQQVKQASVMDSGDLNQTPGASNGAAAAVVGGFLDAFGGGDTPNPASFTAEWLEYVIQSPGEPDRVIRREIFDHAGPAARRAHNPPAAFTDASRLARGLDLFGEVNILPLAFQPSPEFVTDLTSSWLVANRSTFEAVIADGTSGKQGAAGLSKLVSLPLDLYNLGVTRKAWSRSAADWYLDRPNILSRHSYLRQEGDSLRRVEAFDIVYNDVAVSPRINDPFRTRLEQGVLDTTVEAVVATQTAGNAAALDDSDQSAPQWTTIRTPQDLKVREWPADIGARVRADIESGQVVRVPLQPGNESQLVWWRIDPKTGSTLGIGARGWGQNLIEKTVLTLLAVAGICSVIAGDDRGGYTIRDEIVCIMTGAAAAAGVAGGGGVAAIVAGIFCAIGTGVWLNDSPWLDQSTTNRHP